MAINDGMSNVPKEDEEPIENPARGIDTDNIQLPDNLEGPAAEAYKNVRGLYSDGQTSEAKDLYDRMKALKLFSKEITFEQIINLSTAKDSVEDES